LNITHSFKILVYFCLQKKHYWDILRLVTFFSLSKILGPLNENEFYAEDFDLLEKITYSTSAEKIKAIIKEMGNISKR